MEFLSTYCLRENWELHRVVLGLIFIVGAIYLLLRYLGLTDKIRRDRVLVGGSYIRQVVLSVLLLPIIIGIGCWIMDLSSVWLLGDQNGPNYGDLKTLETLPPVEHSTFESVLATFWSVYYHFVDPGNQHMTLGYLAAFVVAIISMLGIFALNGLLVSTIINWVDDRKEKWERGDVRYDDVKRFKDYVAIIGGHEMVPQLCRHIFEAKGNPPFILIQCRGRVGVLRRKLASALTPEQEQRVIIYYGDRTSNEDIASLKLERAREIYLIGENPKIDENEHDALNMLSLNCITTYLKDHCAEGQPPISCRVMFEYQTTFSVFQFSDLDASKRQQINFRPFNFYEMWAQRIFVKSLDVAPKNKEEIYMPLDTWYEDNGKRVCHGITYESDKQVHLVVVGMSKVGIAMAVEAAHVAHYPNFLRDTKLRTKITFIDANAWQEMHFFTGRYKDLFELSHWSYQDTTGRRKAITHTPDQAKWNHLGNLEELIDIEWEFIEGALESPAVQNYMRDLEANENELLTVAMCLTQTHQAVAGALYMPQETIAKAVQVLVYQPFNDSIIGNISGTTAVNERYKRFKPFGMVTSGCEVVGMSDRAARLINHVYWDVRDWKLEQLESVDRDWDYAVSNAENGKSGAAARWSNIYNANTIATKLRSIGWTDDAAKPVQDIEEQMVLRLAMVEHNRWTVEQLLLNYRPVSAAVQLELKEDCDQISELEAVIDACPTEEERDAKTKELKPDLRRLKRPKDGWKQRMYHHDICTYERLREVDFPTLKYDIAICRSLPYIVRALKPKSEKENPKK